LTWSGRIHRIRRLAPGAFWTLLLMAVCTGCGDPQAPEISAVRISYRAVTGDWVGVADVRNGTVEGSPVVIETVMTDNTAVVDPTLTLIAERRDVEAWRQGLFQGRCRGGPDSAYECDLACSKPAGGDAYVCEPALPAEALIRGDRYLVSLTAEDGDFQLEVSVREAFGFQAGFTEPVEEYRVLKLANVLGDPNPFLWALRYRSRKDAQGAWVNEEPLRYGDSLRLGAGGDGWFQLLVSETVELQGAAHTLTAPPKVTWKSLVKWNQPFALSPDAKTGSVAKAFSFFDPRAGSQIEEPGEGAVYTFALEAHDVPDQKDGAVRSRRETFQVQFLPPVQGVPEPTLVVNELGESGTAVEETTEATHLLTGNVSSIAGDVQSLRFVLSDAQGGRSRVHVLDTETISLLGEFAVTIHLVSDWGDGAEADKAAGASVLNRLAVVANDVRGQSTTHAYEFPFVPPADVSPPALSLLEFFPSLGVTAQGLLPAKESVCIRAVASDNGGQPEGSSQLCRCSPDRALEAVNRSRCDCGEEFRWDGDASGRFPADPWEMIRFQPEAVAPEEDIGILRAREPLAQGSRLFAALGVTLEPDETASAYAVRASTAVSKGPTNTQIAPGNATVIEPEQALTARVSVLANVLPVRRLVALYNGLRPEEAVGLAEPVVTFGEAGNYILEWTFPAGQVNQGTRICLGGESVAGHQTLQLMEFTEVRDGWMVGVSVVTDEASCVP